jgi:hypothetical protein
MPCVSAFVVLHPPSRWVGALLDSWSFWECVLRVIVIETATAATARSLARDDLCNFGHLRSLCASHCAPRVWTRGIDVLPLKVDERIVKEEER